MRVSLRLLVALAAPVAAAVLAAPGAAANPIQTENARAGTTAWNVPSALLRVQGYTSEISALPGQLVHLHVRAEAPYQIKLYRLGWYGGRGGRLVATLARRAGWHARGAQQPTNDLMDAGWPVTDTWRVPATAVSGYYLADAVLPNGRGAEIPFLVRSARPSTILVQASVNTWEAYNNWGGKSLYDSNSADHQQVFKVSFNRPFVDDVSNAGPLQFEYPMVRFLESHGLDVSYTTDVDTERVPAEFLRHKLMMAIGHAEYWSKQERAAFDAARDHGVNLAFMGGNVNNWQSRYEDSSRTLVEYRDAAKDPLPDASARTDLTRKFNPQCSLLGIEYQGGFEPNAVHDFTVNAAALSDPWFAGTGFTSGSTAHVVGYEWDGLWPRCSVTNQTVFFSYSDANGGSDLIRYVAPSGAKVMSVGDMLFAWALDNSGHGSRRVAVDPRLQRFTLNALADLSR